MDVEIATISSVGSRQTSQQRISMESVSLIRASSPSSPILDAARDSGGGTVTEVTTLSPPIGQFIVNTILNVFGVAAAIAFGLFAVHSVQLASNANKLAAIANNQSEVNNQMALINFCLPKNDVSI